jgi:SAM-dependent methyltransferase
MKKLELAYDRDKFWQQYWSEHGIDHSEFLDLEMYPIRMTLRHARPSDRILECGFGAGRVLRHLNAKGYQPIGIEHDLTIATALHREDKALRIACGDASRLPFPDNSFDLTLAFGVLGTLHSRTALGLLELMRVTRPGGTLVVSVMVDNVARTFQKLLNRMVARGDPQFYAWTDSEKGWSAYFESFGLRTIETEPMVSRYNLFYWAPILRARTATDLTLARVDDSQYRLNAIGELLWQVHRRVLRRGLAAAVTFALANEKRAIPR